MTISLLKKYLSIVLILWATFVMAQEYPILTKIVTDNAQILSQEELQNFSSKLTNFETETANQIVVLTIEQLHQESIERYANKTFEANRLGQKGKDNGILIVVSEKDRAVRIEVGYGLEPYITDAIASRIIRQTLIPNFREGDYYTGLNSATDTIIEIIGNSEASEEQTHTFEFDFKTMIFHGILALFQLMISGLFGFLFYLQYKHIFIDVFRGLLIGKISLFNFPIVLLKTLPLTLLLFGASLGILLSIPFITFNLDSSMLFNALEDLRFILLVMSVFLIITLFFAIRRIKGKNEKFGFSWSVSDPEFESKNFGSSGANSNIISSSDSYDSSSYNKSSRRSSSSFSGGGGRSGGGGASGSW